MNHQHISTVIVDDQDDVRLLLRMVLEHGADDLAIVGEAASGAEALTLIERLEPDCVVLDIMMPGMDGLQVARRIREQRPDQRIVFCSAHLDRIRARDVDALHGERFLSKDEMAALPVEVRSAVAA